ncbi:hypothetical protein C3942_10930 [Solimonas fluminis]|uniref:Uncharacterized protein n=1 Tax=Solimonas fluminis TaxID=2086571 RepID=A0A2S5TFX6_9GAMM|nr:hypothetical protein [Solimonas fluminis]PPE73906.1 hypothetical protein C3942_10930 [Solimonas fluminis]
MRRPTIIILLLGSNAWWAARLLDAGISYAYRGDSLQQTTEALRQSLAIIRAAVPPEATRESVLAAAAAAAPGAHPFEKEGYVWVGSLGLRFAENGRLAQAVPAWSPLGDEGE